MIKESFNPGRREFAQIHCRETAKTLLRAYELAWGKKGDGEVRDQFGLSAKARGLKQTGARARFLAAGSRDLGLVFQHFLATGRASLLWMGEIENPNTSV